MTANSGVAVKPISAKQLNHAEKSGLEIEDVCVKEAPLANSFNAIETRFYDIERR